MIKPPSDEVTALFIYFDKSHPFIPGENNLKVSLEHFTPFSSILEKQEKCKRYRTLN